MCNVEEDGEIEAQRYDNSKSLRGKKCVKCDQDGVVVTRIHDAFCKSCFQVYVIHKFRAAIGKSKLIRAGENVLLAFSGGANSSALLHLVQDGLSERAHRKLRFTPTVLHIDECGILDVNGDARKELRQKIGRLMWSSGFSSYITDLEEALKIERKRTHSPASTDGKNVDDLGLCQRVEDGFDGSTLPPPAQSDELRSVIQSLASVSSQEDFIRNLRTQLIVSVARHLGFTKILTAESSTRLSIRILTDVAQGRGSQVSLNTAFCDGRNGDVSVIRPVRDLNAKELVMYNSLFGVDSVFIPNITTKTTQNSSLERLTENFVTGLQADFSSTVTNIVRTSEKLELPPVEQEPACAFCQSPLDTNVGKASALFSIEFSQKICEPPSTVCVESTSSKVCSSECKEAVNKLSNTELNKTLCYGCCLTLQNFNYEKSSLPDFIIKESFETTQREELRTKISEFLLEEDNS